ncbi:MAG TPA: hypothetical protein VFB45_22180 [Pseudolabrys sp.]|nr:hypothetical protein [Pseudolabrys sp.]
MNRHLVACALAVSALTFDAAQSAEVFYENFSNSIRAVYGSNWAVFIPFTAPPAPADDANRIGETYPGHLWNFTSTKTSKGGTVYEQADSYCPGSQTPKPFPGGGAVFKDFQDLTQFKLTGDITIGPVKISALDAEYLKSVKTDIASVKRMYLPGGNVLKAAVKTAVSACGPDYFYAVTGVLMGKPTITVTFDRSVDAGIAANISSKISFNLGVHAHVVQYGTADKPLIIQTDDVEIFAVQAVPVATLK